MKKLGQRKKDSLKEAIVNVLIGYTVAILTQALVFPLFGLKVNMTDNLIIAAIFSTVSILRTYLIRRYWNRKHIKNLQEKYQIKRKKG